MRKVFFEAIKRTGKRSFWVAILTCIAMIYVWSTINTQIVEYYYSNWIYLYIAQTLTTFNAVVSFSLAELLLLLLLITISISIIIITRQIYLHRLTVNRLLRIALVVSGKFFSLTTLLFLVIWGINYQRQPLGEKLHFAPQKAEIEELVTICQFLIMATNQNYEKANPIIKEIEGSQLPFNMSELYGVIESAYTKQLLLGRAREKNLGPPKPLYFSGIMSRLGISGIYIPFTGEPNFNTEQPACELPYTIAHEKAHQRGFALESEANFVAFLVCTSSTEAYCRYSGYLMASLQFLRSLRNLDSARYQYLVDKLAPGPRSDLKALNHFWKRYEGMGMQFSQLVNNTYLKANRVTSGTENYDEVVALIVGFHRIKPVNIVTNN